MSDVGMVAVIVGAQVVSMLGLGYVLSSRIGAAGARLGHRLATIEGRITTLLRDVAVLKCHVGLLTTGRGHETS